MYIFCHLGKLSYGVSFIFACLSSGCTRLRPCCVEEDRPALHLSAWICTQTPAQWPHVQTGLRQFQGHPWDSVRTGQSQESLAKRGCSQWSAPAGVYSRKVNRVVQLFYPKFFMRENNLIQFRPIAEKTKNSSQRIKDACSNWRTHQATTIDIPQLHRVLLFIIITKSFEFHKSRKGIIMKVSHINV